MVARSIVLRFPARCFACNTSLSAGTQARWYGRGRVSCVRCTSTAPVDNPWPADAVGAVDPGTQTMVRRQGKLDACEPELIEQAQYDALGTAQAAADRRGYCNGLKLSEGKRALYLREFLSTVGELVRLKDYAHEAGVKLSTEEVAKLYKSSDFLVAQTQCRIDDSKVANELGGDADRPALPPSASPEIRKFVAETEDALKRAGPTPEVRAIEARVDDGLSPEDVATLASSGSALMLVVRLRSGARFIVRAYDAHRIIRCIEESCIDRVRDVMRAAGGGL